MTSSSSCQLDILAEVPDPRHKKGKRYPLSLSLARHRSDTGHGYTSVTWAGKLIQALEI